MALRQGAVLWAVLFVGMAWSVEGMRGDRPGQFRLSHFGSYGHKDGDHTNDPAFLATNPKKKLTRQLNHAYEFIQPGSREALSLHETDRLKTKGLRMRAQSRSASVRARSMSIMSRGGSRGSSAGGSRTRSGTRSGSSVQTQSPRARLERFFSDPKMNVWDAMRVLRLCGNRADEKVPGGFWTWSSRPKSLLDRYAPLKKKAKKLDKDGKAVVKVKKEKGKEKLLLSEQALWGKVWPLARGLMRNGLGEGEDGMVSEQQLKDITEECKAAMTASGAYRNGIRVKKHKMRKNKRSAEQAGPKKMVDEDEDDE